jgi:hypothetical protein
MSAPAPILCEWDGDAFVPVNQSWARRADQHYTVHERYSIAPIEERSQRSHAHYFASVNDAWKNLPEHMTERFPTSEHLRKWALVKAGWRDERSIVCASKAEAQRVKSFIRPMDDYAVVIAREAVVLVYTAKSQSVRAMGKADFQKSKDDVLQVLAEMIGTTAGEIKQNAKDAA